LELVTTKAQPIKTIPFALVISKDMKNSIWHSSGTGERWQLWQQELLFLTA